ncbi:MAG: hypothetical protein ACTSRA_10460, partial [Promethearchaeota archaeon]
IRPMYHHSDTCIRAHVFVCVLALLLLSLLRLYLSRKHFNITYDEIIDSLGSIYLNKVHLSRDATPIMKIEKLAGLSARLSRVLGLGSLIR